MGALNMFKRISIVCAVVLFISTGIFAVSISSQTEENTQKTEAYIQKGTVNSGSGILSQLLADLQNKGLCVIDKTCVFRFDFAYFIWSPEWGNVIHEIDIGNPNLPILKAGPVPRDAPRIGATFDIVLTGAPTNATRAILFFGFSAKTWSGGTLPFDLSAFGMPTCALYVSPDIPVPMTLNGGIGKRCVTLPNSTDLIGKMFFNQVFIPASKIVSNGTKGVISR